MNPQKDAQLERVYERFERDHERLADELMESLVHEQPGEAATNPYQIRRWIVRATIGLAAAGVVSVVGWLAVVSLSPSPAYAFADIPERLRELRSIHVQGLLHQGGRWVPFEHYAERPSRYGHMWLEAIGEGNGYAASDGKRYIRVNHLEREAVVGAEIPLAAELITEQMFFRWSGEGAVAELAGFERIGVETIDGVRTEVYEAWEDDEFRNVIWFNPATGLPVQVKGYYVDPKTRVEEMDFEINRIAVNVPPPEGRFSLDPPEDYAIRVRDRSRDEVGSSSAQKAGTVHFAERFAFRIDDRAVLLCWAFYDASESPPIEPDLGERPGQRLEFSPESEDGTIRYAAYHLRADRSVLHHWRWTLLVPEAPATSIGDGTLTWTREGLHYHSVSARRALQFDRERLGRFVVEAQRVTLPVDVDDDVAADAVLTLEEIERLMEHLPQ